MTSAGAMVNLPDTITRNRSSQACDNCFRQKVRHLQYSTSFPHSIMHELNTHISDRSNVMIHTLSVIGAPIEALPVLTIGKGSEDLEGFLPSGMPFQSLRHFDSGLI